MSNSTSFTFQPPGQVTISRTSRALVAEKTGERRREKSGGRPGFPSANLMTAPDQKMSDHLADWPGHVREGM